MSGGAKGGSRSILLINLLTAWVGLCEIRILAHGKLASQVIVFIVVAAIKRVAFLYLLLDAS
jgi:hypothetical protein